MSSICYTIGEDSSVNDPSGCRICLLGNNTSNGWKKISVEDYYNPQTDDYLNCSAFYRCCGDSGFTISSHEVMLSFYAACLVGYALYEILLYRKKRALEEKFISEGVSIQATLTEQWSEPVMVGSHNSEHSNSYREAVPAMEFTNTLGETVVRGTSLCRSTQGRHISGQSLTIQHIPDYPQSALESYEDRQQSQNCGLLLLALIGLVWCITYIGLCAGSYYAPFWYGLVRQLLFLVYTLPFMAGLVYFAIYNKALQRNYLIYEDDVLRNVQRTSKNFRHRRIVWGKQTEDGEWTMSTAPQQ